MKCLEKRHHWPTATLVLALLSTPLQAWGEEGHRISGKAAALSLPSSMPAFFRQAADHLAYLNA